MNYKNFTITRGDSLEFRLNFLNASQAPDELYFTVKDKSSDTVYVFQKSFDDGITPVETEDDDVISYDVYIPHTDTSDLKLLNYIFQILAVFGSDYETVAEGKLIITPEV